MKNAVFFVLFQWSMKREQGKESSIRYSRRVVEFVFCLFKLNHASRFASIIFNLN